MIKIWGTLDASAGLRRKNENKYSKNFSLQRRSDRGGQRKENGNGSDLS